ncbi:Hypothetical protein MSYG_1175 [Malassezia sympodialis ATCC 42132]|uniref:DUF202 domain-containing protein n=1 Tax=Malassezia sympodialis (strain ATCC 42132) TaxID=1230383 RepID=A0A1M8A333_MALS4|nr:Hypothetical protein MSYG_1175 [Malassezia sympodialis ATCC 42132]
MNKLWPELENKGSVARDHLALERTFLAWMRSSLSLVAIGIAISQLFRLPELIVDEGQNAPKPFAQLRGQSIMVDGKIHLQTLQRLGTPIGIAFVGVGVLVLLVGAVRFFHAQNIMIRGKFIPSRVESKYYMDSHS